MEKQVYDFIAAQTGEKIVERKKCPGCGQEFAITDKDLEFYKKISPVFNGTKYEIPAPTLCPDCRNQRRLTRRNERRLYKRKCDLTGRIMVSIYAPESPYVVYNQTDRWWDNWNAMDYGRDFDFARPFFQQFNDLMLQVPRMSITNEGSENSEYTNQSGNNKNCYMLTSSSFQENSLYWHWCQKWKFNVDSLLTEWSEEIYQSINIKNWYKNFYCISLNNCSNCYYCDNCISSQYCIWSTWINNWKYYILNKQVSEKEYNECLEKLFIDKNFYQQFLTDYNNLKKEIPHKYYIWFWNEGFAGDYVINCKDTYYSFNTRNCENIKYCNDAWDEQNSYDFTETLDDKFCYELQWSATSNKSAFVSQVWYLTDCFYCNLCFYSSNLFGCIWLRNKQYCILNKQYTKEEYEELVPKIIEKMKETWERWEFFPANISLFSYNESVAIEYFPLSKEESLKKWYKRQDKEYPINVPDWIELVRAQDLPEDIHDVDDEILKKAVVCEVSGKPFRIVKPELEFYRKHNLPLPRKHPDVRHLERMSKRAPRQLYLRECDNCGKQVVSVYPADSEFKVYCEECYNKETY